MKYFLQILTVVLIFNFSNINAQTYNSFYNDIVSNVSQANILADLNTFEAFGVKTIGTTALNNTQAWIKSRYQSLGYTDIVEQPFSYSGGTTNNIIITKTGTTYPNTFLIIDAHFDPINGPGTNDNGSGTVLIMELARLLKDVDTEYSIKFIHFSGEEYGLIGSNYYVDNTVIPENLDIKLVFNIDEVGGDGSKTNDTIVCERDQGSPTTNNAASNVATQELATCIELYSSLNTEISYAYGSDYMPFEDNGEIITGLYEKNVTPHYHSPTDVLANMDVPYLTEVTKGSLGAALYFSVAFETLNTNSFDNVPLNIYPNPSNGIITISKTINEDFELSIVDVLGKEVFNSQMESNTQNFDLRHLNKGVYIALLKNSNYSVSKKVVLH